jgi:hypothetical protein
MPTYGNSKKRDMARSILPSTKKDVQKDRRRIHKRARTHERALMLKCEEGEGDFLSVDLARSRETRNLVEERRFKDKAGPFERWAERVTLQIRQEDRLSYLRALVPASLIGEHALSHVEWKDNFRDPAEANNSRHYPSRRDLEKSEREELTQKIRALFTDTLDHARLNQALKKAHRTHRIYYKDYPIPVKVGKTSPRTLQGIHDVESFIKDLFRASLVGSEIVRDDRLDPRYHQLVNYGPDAGAFRIPSPDHHPEWLEALRAFFRVRRAA